MTGAEHLRGALTAARARREELRRRSFAARLAADPRMAGLTALTRILGATGRTAPFRARLFDGRAMHVVLPEAVSTEIARFGYVEENVVLAMLRCIRPGDTVFDVGAHFGFLTLVAARLVGEAGEVHAFEPMPGTFEVLSRNAERSSAIRAVNAAAWREEGEVEMRDFGAALSAFNTTRAPRFKEGIAPASTARRVKAMTLDAYAWASGARPSFVKIDAENAELDVLAGMERLLREVRPAIVLEVGDDGATTSSGKIVRHVLDRGYEALEQAGGDFHPHRIQPAYRYTNLLFVPAGAGA